MNPRTLFRRIGRVARRDQLDAEAERELAFHVDMRTAQLTESGTPPEESRRRALAEFGGRIQVRESCRDARGLPLFETLAQDFRYGARMIRRSPGSAAVAIATLALGIGVNAAFFSAVNAILLRPLPFTHENRLLLLHQPAPGAGVEDAQFSPPEVRDLAEQSRTLDSIAEYHSMEFTLLGHGDPIRVRTGVVSASFFDLLGVRPALGRTFRAGEDGHGAPPVLVLSHDFWQNTLGGDPAIVGKAFEMNDRVHTVVGVLPALPQYPDENDVYMPVSACPFRARKGWDENRGGRGLTVFARRRIGSTTEQARRELGVIAARLRTRYPDAYPAGARSTFDASPLRDDLTRNARLTFVALLATAGFVLLIACANVANLTLARLSRRRRELAVRAAIGAGRARILRQLVTESTMIALAGGALGLGIALVSRHFLVSFAGRFTPRAAEISVDGRVLLFTVAVSLVTGIAFGAFPGLRGMRDLAGALKESDEGRTVAGGRRGNGLLVIPQVAVSLVLLVAAGLLVKSLIRLSRVDPGFAPENVLTARVSLDWSRYTKPEQSRALYDRLLEKVSGFPGVREAAVASAFPFSGGTPFNSDMEIEGRPTPAGQAAPQVYPQVVGPAFFRVVGIPLLRGRAFTDHEMPDARDAHLVVVVNAAFARRYFGSEAAALGHRINIGGPPVDWREIVGVVGDVKQFGLDKPAGEEAYVPYVQGGGNTMRVLVRASSDPERLSRQLVAAVHELDRTAPVSDVHTLERLKHSSLDSPRLTTTLFTGFALLALAIAAAGIGAVTAFSVGQRTREIGIRMALGASKRDVLGMVLRQGMRPVFIGLAIGLAGAFAFARVLSALLYTVAPTDLPTFLLVSAALVATAAVACLVPGRRAVRVDPMVALRS
ncbi:MAG TPA: ABC transporter permease [Thermoanaerobaculia bacterium]|nr:ABC transporter permease [Thermoanaerobaculia bacterium]